MNNRITYYEIEGKQYALNFSTNAAETVLERYGDYSGLDVAMGYTDKDEGKTGAELQAANTAIVKETVWILALLMREGANYLTIIGEDSQKPLTEEQISTLLGRHEVLMKARVAAMQAIRAGLAVSVEVEENPKNENATQDE